MILLLPLCVHKIIGYVFLIKKHVKQQNLTVSLAVPQVQVIPNEHKILWDAGENLRKEKSYMLQHRQYAVLYV
jgi:hypothetical protein